MSILIKGSINIPKCCDECKFKYSINCKTYTGYHHQDTNRANKCPITVVPNIETGYWINYKCSKCGKGIEDLIDCREWYDNEEPNFCPFCGIKFEKEEK